jgi:RNA ligase (TIGR02306 family)
MTEVLETKHEETTKNNSLDKLEDMIKSFQDKNNMDIQNSLLKKKFVDFLQTKRSDPDFLEKITKQVNEKFSDFQKVGTEFISQEIEEIIKDLITEKMTLTVRNTDVRDTSPLASIQYVHSPKPIPKRDKIVTATVKGFPVVVNKEQFFQSENKSLCVFFEPDALLDPNNDAFKFLEAKKGGGGPRRVTSVKMYGAFSQGLCMPLEIVRFYGLDPNALKEGQDLTSTLKVTKYISEEEKTQYVASPAGIPFPTQQVPKTDEPNLQALQDILKDLQNRHVTITQKVDGSSMTVTHDGKLCGRNFEWTEKNGNNSAYYEMDDKYKIREKIKDSGLNFQGELCGPKIQNNPTGFDDKKWLVFNIFDSKTNQYLPHTQVVKLCQQFGFETVPCLFEDILLSDLQFHSIQDWLDFANKQTYTNNNKPAEGIVVKTVDHDETQPRISFKVISQVYLTQK